MSKFELQKIGLELRAMCTGHCSECALHDVCRDELTGQCLDMLGQRIVGCARPADMTFEDALIMLRQLKRVSRKGWNGKGMWIQLQIPDSDSKMSLPYIYMKTASGNFVPWVASHTDILSSDWMLVE